MQPWDIFARLAGMLEIHYGILYECNFMKPLNLLRDVIFDKVNVMKTLFWEINWAPFDMQS